jgi:GNAT superfamily N-acetyltransferase
VHLESWKTTYPGIVPQAYIDSLKVEDGVARWNRLLTDRAVLAFVVEDEARIFGFAAGGAAIHPVDGYHGEMSAIYLLATHQGQGAGAALTRRMAHALREKGFRSMVVWALTANPACGFYEHMGGVHVAEQMIAIGGVDLPEAAFGWTDLNALAQAFE